MRLLHVVAQVIKRVLSRFNAFTIFIVVSPFASMTILILFAPALLSWNGEPWRPLSRQEIVERSLEMIESRWSPNKICQGWNSGISPAYFYPNTSYYGLLYTQHNSYQNGKGARAQNNWTEFSYGITRLPYDHYGYWSGNRWYNYYGHDCSGFVSICWVLPSRYTTRLFHSDANGTQSYCYPLGPVGSAVSTHLLPGDALNEEGSHIILFDRKLENNKVESLEQTPNNARKRAWFYSSLSTYQPIRRKEIADAARSFVSIADYPRMVAAEVSFSVAIDFVVAAQQAPADLHLEIKHRQSGMILDSGKMLNAGEGNGTVTFSGFSLPHSDENYYVYFYCYITPAGGTKDNLYVQDSSVSHPTLVRCRKRGNIKLSS